jgi:1-aminocyclopropane-1-carboxylate deaminase
LFFSTHDISTDIVDAPLFRSKGIRLSVLRADKLHPVVSGNKLFKLHYFLEQALQIPKPTLVTFGGAWSNHLVATAFACKEAGIRCIGIVRGEEPVQPSHTLQQCKQFGMQLQFISRQAYGHKSEPHFLAELTKQWGPHVLVPEGGYHPLGAKGAAMLLPLAQAATYTHIASALGTATTVAGLLLAAPADTTVMGFAALKGMTDLPKRLSYLLDGAQPAAPFVPVHDYCLAGYAKKDARLFDFMNQVWQQFQLPTDFVYTAKMLYGIYDLAAQDYFATGSHVLCIHTGGLQGNSSLPTKTLTF